MSYGIRTRSQLNIHCRRFRLLVEVVVKARTQVVAVADVVAVAVVWVVVGAGVACIGLAIAEELAALGARVVLASRKPSRLTTAATYYYFYKYYQSNQSTYLC